MGRILVATHNSGKLKEFSGLLGPLGYEVVSAAEMGLGEPEETGRTFAENARVKARAAALASGLPALADDSGLCVAALGGGPGVFSARYAAGDYPAAFERIIAAAVQAREWRARFVCELCLAQPSGETATYVGQVDGVIAKSPSGGGGFGYDAIFVPDGYDKTFAEMPEVKVLVGHRARALAQFLAGLGR